MRVAIWWLLLSDGIFCRASDSPQYYLTRQGRQVVLRRGDVTLPPLERYLTWVPDSAPPPTRYHGDLTSPAPSGNRDNQENTPPQDASRKLLRRLQPRRRRGKQPGSSTNDNSASWKTGTGFRTANRNSALKGTASATRPRSTANDNSAFPEAGSATRPRSMANANSAFPGAGNRPGIGRSMRSTPKEHPWTFLRPQHSQSPRIWTNQNSEHRFDPDHSEFWGVYKLAQPSIQQDYHNRICRDSFCGSGLSSPALQRTPHYSFSGSPSGLLHQNCLTDPYRGERNAGGSRPGLAFPLPRAARPDTWLELDTAPPEAAALSHVERPPMALDIPETGRLEETRCPESSQSRGSRSPRHHTRKRPKNRSSGVYQPKKRSPHRGHWCEWLASPWNKQKIADDLV